MILAKLSGRSKTAHSSRVTTSAISNGTRVNRTSPTRRSVIQQEGDGKQRKNPCLDERSDDGSARLVERYRLTRCIWLDCEYRRHEIMQHCGIVRIPLWEYLDTCTSFRSHPISSNLSRDAFQANPLRLEFLPEQVKRLR